MTYDSRIKRKSEQALKSLEQNLTFQIAYLARTLEIDGAEKLQGSELKLTDYRILLAIELFDRLTAADLHRILLIDPAQISRTVSSLSGRKLVTITPDSINKRIKWLALDHVGQQKLDLVKPLFEQRQRDIENTLDPKELIYLNRIIKKITTTMSK
jgi:DNA-binding MarR family transcriptional regulator